MPRRHPLECVHLNLTKRHPRLPPPLPGADDQVYRPPVEYRLELDKPLRLLWGRQGPNPSGAQHPAPLSRPPPRPHFLPSFKLVICEAVQTL